MENSVHYYLLYKAVVGKRVDPYEDYIWRNGEWQKDEEGDIADHLVGYDPTESCSIYQYWKSDILEEIEEISEEEAMKRIEGDNKP